MPLSVPNDTPPSSTVGAENRSRVRLPTGGKPADDAAGQRLLPEEARGARGRDDAAAVIQVIARLQSHLQEAARDGEAADARVGSAGVEFAVLRVVERDLHVEVAARCTRGATQGRLRAGADAAVD